MATDDYFIDDLLRYFPVAMRETYREEILNHRLRPAIVATMMTNSIINRAGISFAYRIAEETGVHPCDIARAYGITRDAFKLRNVWADIEALDSRLDAQIQAELFIAVRHFIENMTRWFLRNCPEPIEISSTMQAYARGIDEFSECFEPLMSKTLRKAYINQMEYFTSQNVPEALARSIARLEVMASACDVVKVANEHALSVSIVGKLYFELGAGLRLGWLRRSASALMSEGYWEQQAIQSLIRELYFQQRRLAADAVSHLCEQGDCGMAYEKWAEIHEKRLKRYHLFIQDLKRQEHVDLSMLVVALRKIEEIAST